MAEWVASLDIDGWSLLFAALALVAGWILSRLARRGVTTLLVRLPSLGEGVKTAIVRVVVYAIILLGVGVALGFLGASVQPLLAIALIVAVVLVLVLRGIADNFAAGVVLQTRRPIEVGDVLTSDDIEGEVVELNGRAVVVKTFDGRIVHLPNGAVLQQPLVNESAHGARRSEVEVRVGAAADGMPEAITEAVRAVEGVHQRERVDVLSRSRSPERQIYRVRFWHHPKHGTTVSSAVVDSLAEALAGRGIPATVTSDPPAAPLTPPFQT